MERISHFAGLVVRGLFLRTDAYEEMREARNPFVEGLFVILVVGVLIALAAVVGTTLGWASSPSLAAIEQQVYDGITSMSWFEQLERAAGSDFLEEFQAQWDWNWRLANTLVPTPLSSLTGIITTPLRLILGWLIYGLLAHVFARWFGGEANLGQTLGTTALAVAPEILNLVGFLPFVVVGGIVGTWTLICRYVALKEAHGLGWARAFWATVLPRLVLGLLAVIILGLSIAGFAALAPMFIPFLGGS
jgi:hypothetical protein